MNPEIAKYALVCAVEKFQTALISLDDEFLTTNLIINGESVDGDKLAQIRAAMNEANHRLLLLEECAAAVDNVGGKLATAMKGSAR